MNVVEAKQETPALASHEDLGVNWPGKKKSDEKLRRISELEAYMRDAQTALAACNAKIDEIGENERKSALKIIELKKEMEILKDPEIGMTPKEFGESPASKDFVNDETRKVNRSVNGLSNKVNGRVDALIYRVDKKFEQLETVADRDRNELLDKIDENYHDLDSRIRDATRFLVQHVHDFGRKILDMDEHIQHLEGQMGWSQDDIPEEDDSEQYAIVPARHHQPRLAPPQRPHRRIMPPPSPAATAHSKPLFDMPPDEKTTGRPALNAKDWTFDALWTSLQASMGKDSQMV